MQVARQKQVHPAPRKRLHRRCGPHHHSVFRVTRRQIHRMMRHHDSCRIRIRPAQLLTGFGNLQRINPPIFPGHHPHRIDPRDRHPRHLAKRRKICTNVAPVTPQRPQRTLQQIRRRNIMIARHHQPRHRRHLPHKRARCPELLLLRPLRKSRRKSQSRPAPASAAQ